MSSDRVARSAFGYLLIGATLLLAPWAVASGTAAETGTRWKTGRALQRALQQPVGVSWSRVPLREHLQQLARSQGVAIWFDRRVDPSQRVDIRFREVPFGELLQGLAGRVGAQAVLIDSVVYLGPPDAARKLPGLVAARQRDVTRLPAAISRRLLRREAWHWEPLSVPSQLLEELARQGRVELDGAAAVPFDLWAAGDLPPLAWVDRLSLVLIGFELTFAVHDRGQRIDLQPVPDQVEPVQPKWVGPPAQSGPAQRPGSGREGRKRYSLRVDHQPIGALLKALQQQTEFTFSFEGPITDRLQQRVQFDVREVTLDRLLEELLSPAGLSHRREGNTITIFSP